MDCRYLTANRVSVKCCQSWQCAPRDAAVRVEGGSSITDIWPVAGQSLPEPFVPGSGDSVPAELRLVLAGYAGIACGLLAGVLACAAVFALPYFFGDDLDRYANMLKRSNQGYWLLFVLALSALVGGLPGGCRLWLRRALTR